jgi:poly(3-hydroxybutyrate) depolymerase
MLILPGFRCELALVVALGGCAGKPAADDDDTATTESADNGTSSGTDEGNTDDDATASTSTEGTNDTGESSDTSDGTTGGPMGSAGCGMADPPSGDLVIDIEGGQGTYVLSLPAGYDPQTPYPLGFAFHGANRTGPQCQQGDCAGFQTAMEDHAVLVYMTCVGGPGWTNDIDLNVSFFETVLDHVRANYCIDEGLVYTAGTSSGAHFVNILGCRLGDRIAAIAPVAGVLFETECGDQVAALVIHGVDDGSFSAGQEARDFYVQRNGCTTTTVPPIPELHDRVVAARESHECAAYQGCDTNKPVVWCEHSEGGYDGSTHGWPRFGGAEIWDFVTSLPDIPPAGG